MTPSTGPERLPTTFEAPVPGRFAAVRKRLEDRARANMPSDEESKPDRLLRAGVYVPDHK